MTPPTHRSPNAQAAQRTRRALRPTPEPGRVAEPVAALQRGVHLLSTDPQLIQAVEAVCVSCRVELTVAGAWDGRNVDRLLVDAAAQPEVLPPGAVIVTLTSRPGTWELAARSVASAVVVLPDAAEWLAELLTRDARESGAETLGRVIGVVGAAGGVGASTFACWLGQALAALGTAAVVDADPHAVGLDLVLGTESEDGLRWPELHQFSGAVAPDQLWAAMPRVGALRYLSWDRHATFASRVPVATVVHALRGAAQTLVLDLDAHRLEEQARWCSVVLVLTPRTVRGVLAAAHTVQRTGVTPAMTVLTGLNVADVDPELVEATTGVGCAGVLDFDPRVPQELDGGTVLQRGLRPRHAKAIRGVLERLEVRP